MEEKHKDILRTELLKTRNEPFTTERILLIQHRKLAGACWRELGIALGIDSRRLDSLTQNYKLDSERADQVLKMWIDDNENDATVERLACALIDIGKEEIVDRLLGGKTKRPTQSEEEQSEQLSESGEESERPIERKLKGDILSLQAEASCQSEKSKQPCEREEEESKRLSEQETPADMSNLAALAAAVKELRENDSERERQQKEIEGLKNQMIEEWKQMKQQFQHVLTSRETLCQVEQSRQPSEGKNSEDIFSLQAEVRELRRIATEIEASVQQRKNEELEKMIKQCKQMEIQVQNLLTYCLWSSGLNCSTSRACQSVLAFQNLSVAVYW